MLNITLLYNGGPNQQDKKEQIHYTLLRIQELLSVYTDTILSWHFHKQADTIPNKLLAMIESIDREVEDVIKMTNTI